MPGVFRQLDQLLQRRMSDEIDQDVFQLCVQAFADARNEAELRKQGGRLKADGVNEATKAALRDEYGRNVQRLRREQREKKERRIADDGGDF